MESTRQAPIVDVKKEKDHNSYAITERSNPNKNSTSVWPSIKSEPGASSSSSCRHPSTSYSQKSHSSTRHHHSSSTSKNQKRPRDDNDDARPPPPPNSNTGPPGIPSYKKLKKKMENEGRNVLLNQPMEDIYDEFYKYFLRARDIVNDRSCEQLMNDVMYSFSANVMCGTEDDIYVPLEISIAAFSIRNGKIIKQPYHVMIDPGRIPDGLAGNAKDHFPEHKIPLPPYCLNWARTDYRRVYEEMLEYVGAEKVMLSYSEHHIKQNIGVLKWLYLQTLPQTDPDGLPIFDDESDLPDAGTWTILCIADYVYSIAKRMNMRSKSISFMITDNLLNREGYSERAMCKYHITEESKWCARSMAVRGFMLLKDLFGSFYTEFLNRKEAIGAPPVRLPIQHNEARESQSRALPSCRSRQWN